MCLYPKKILTRPNGRVGEKVTVSCGKCLECVRQKSLEWAYRIMDECSLYEQNCFVTLTFDEANKPVDGCVRRSDIQLFMKRLRKRLSPLRVRFFACGEYGKKLGRPHYHLIIFNWWPSDAWFFQRKDGVDLYRSSLLEDVWPFGFSSVGRVTFDSAIYCAKYMGKYAYENTSRLVSFNPTPFRLYPPFVQMSNRPGIGYDCVYNCDLNSDRIYRNGRGIKIPRYYLKVMECDGLFLDDFKERRRKQGELVERCTDINQRRMEYKRKFLDPVKGL